MALQAFARAATAALAVAALTLTAPGAGAASASRSSVTSTPTTSRLAGADRVGTAVKISQHAYPQSFTSGGSVYLARMDVFADAVAAGTLTDGPVLLVPSCSMVPQVVKDEVTRLAPARVVALGGTGAVCDQVLSDAATGRPTTRLAGADRYLTSLEIARERLRQGSVSEVYVASGMDSPDAVVGGQLTRGPILLTGTVDRSAEYNTFIDQVKPIRVMALGGEGVVSYDQLNSLHGVKERLLGPTRYETAGAVAMRQFPADADTVYLARGDLFADAVAAGALTDGPVLLVESCALPVLVSQRIAAARPLHIVALGGPGAICDSVLSQAAAASSLNQGRNLPLVTDETGWQAGHETVAAISATGRYAVFSGMPDTNSSGGLGLHVVDRDTGAHENVGVRTDGTTFVTTGAVAAAISSDGRYVAFSTLDKNTAAGDANAVSDVYLYDRTAKATTLLSRTPQGAAGNAWSSLGDLSADGSTVIFNSAASDLVAGDTNDSTDVFAYDVATGAVSRVSVAADGSQLVGGDSSSWAITADGGRIAMVSAAQNVMPDVATGTRSVYIRDLGSGAMQFVSRDESGTPLTRYTYDAAISGDGTVVAYTVQGAPYQAGETFVRDLTSGTTTQVTPGADQDIELSGDGRWIVAGALGEPRTIRLYDRSSETWSVLSTMPSGAPTIFDSWGPSISHDGSVVSYVSEDSRIFLVRESRYESAFIWERIVPR